MGSQDDDDDDQGGGHNLQQDFDDEVDKGDTGLEEATGEMGNVISSN